jgi:cardiolipin synthase
MVVMIVFPVTGVLLYFFFGRDWRAPRNSKWVQRLRGELAPKMAPYYDRFRAQIDRTRERWDGTFVEKLINAIQNTDTVQPLPVTSYRFFADGQGFFDSMIEDMKNAEHVIEHLYFIWEQDELTARMTEVMLAKIAEGVKVRIIYDKVGSSTYKKDELKKLAAAGAEIYADHASFQLLNYRDHRKITVVDYEIGYSGGFNVGQEYIDGGAAYPAWRDSGFRITGPGVAELQLWFAARWISLTKENLVGEEFFPKTDPAELGPDPLMIQVVAHGVDDPWESGRRLHAIAFGAAQKTIRLQSPYFVPDLTLYDNLIDAALAGVDVKFIMTGWPDHTNAFETAKSYWPKLLEAGGRIYLYEAGFFHAKTLAVDSTACAIGTMNMDRRSLYLQKEMMTWIYDEERTLELEAQFDEDLKLCREVTLEEVRAYSFGERLQQRTFRLVGNLL